MKALPLNEVYQLASVMTYRDFKEEIDYRITGQLKTAVSDNEFVLIQKQ